MAQSDYGAATPIVNWRDKLGRLYDRLNQPTRNPLRKQDTSWHDSMVRKANESFREAAAREAERKQAARRKAPARTASTRKAAARKAPAHRPAGYRTSSRKGTR